MARQRVAELVAQMKARRGQAEAANANVDPLELDLDLKDRKALLKPIIR